MYAALTGILIRTHLFSAVYDSGCIPTACMPCHQVVISRVYNRASTSDYGNYQPLTIMPSLYKPYSTLLIRRTTPDAGS